MVDAYRSSKTVPEEIIFVRSPRPEIDGFRWAPATILNQGVQLFRPFERNGVQTASDFQLLRNVITLLDILDYDDAFYNFYYIYSGTERFLDLFLALSDYPPDINVEQPSRRLVCPAIILQKSEENLPQISRGVLVSEVEYDEIEKGSKCKLEMQVSLDRWTQANAATLRNRTSSGGLAQSQGWKGPFNLQGRLEELRRWCIR